MYSAHNPTIADHIHGSPQGIIDAGLFVLLTIRQPLSMVPEMLAEVSASGTNSRFLFGAKRKGYSYLLVNATDMHAKLARIDSRYGRTTAAGARAAVALFYRVPNLGAVKAGFLAQLAGYDVGCLDSHNLELYGIPANVVNVRKTLKRTTQRRKLSEYIELTRTHGGSAGLWDEWCNHVAGTYNGDFAAELETGYQVSEFHERCICGDLAPLAEEEIF